MNLIFCTFLVSLLKYGSEAANVLGPSVYVVTPSPRSQTENEARSAPFYYHNWMRRMDSPQNVTTTSTTPKVKTPDLIFAEFESEREDNMQKSIRKLLEKERVAAKTSTTSTTTSRPIYVPEEEDNNVNYDSGYIAPKQDTKKEDSKKSEADMTDYFALYNNLYGDVKNSLIPTDPRPNNLPSTTSSTTTTTTTTPATNVENIWHIIDAEKHNMYSGQWEEAPLDSNFDKDEIGGDNVKPQESDDQRNHKQDNDSLPDNFALPGFSASHGNGAENESRAIRTEPNIRFPYVSLKPFIMKNMNKAIQNDFSNSKTSNNMFSLDDFKEIKHPVRGEIQDTVQVREPIDRYNPAQPYLPQEYGSKSKQSNPSSPPSKAVANLVPPPPPPLPKVTGNDFPSPTNYESFPPYPPAVLSPSPPQSPPPRNPPVSVYNPPASISEDAGMGSPPDDNSDNTPMDLGYRYKPPSPSAFLPTLPPLSKPFNGYSYEKPGDSPPAIDMSGYNYNKPAMTLDSPPTMDMGGYTYNKPALTFDSGPAIGGGVSDDKPDIHQYSYGKLQPPDDHHASSYDHHNPPSPSFHHDSDYPELVFDKPHGSGAVKGGDDMKGQDVAMMPPPPPTQMNPGLDSGPPSDDGFPPDFPGDFKYHHDLDDHDFHHYHHHHPTTTTTTTEMPRVNRFSYYYLGKKLYYLPLYFSVYFIVYVGALIIKAVLRHKIVYPNSWRPNDTTASFFSKRSVDSWNLSNENLHEVTGRVTKAIAEAAEKYMNDKTKPKSI